MKKILHIAKNVLVWGLVILAVTMMIFTVVSTRMFDQNNRDIFGYKAFIVKSDSMSKTDFDAGDLIILKEVDPRTLVEGDIIAYKSTNKHNYNDTVTHKIRSLTSDQDGNPGFITYGTTTGVDDEQIVLHKYVLGKYQFRLPMVGRFFAFLKTVPGYILCILTPFLAIILMQVFNCVKLFKIYKSEKMEEIEAEKKALEEERAKSKEMMDELVRLREQLKSAQTNSGDSLTQNVDDSAN